MIGKFDMARLELFAIARGAFSDKPIHLLANRDVAGSLSLGLNTEGVRRGNEIRDILVASENGEQWKDRVIEILSGDDPGLANTMVVYFLIGLGITRMCLDCMHGFESLRDSQDEEE